MMRTDYVATPDYFASVVGLTLDELLKPVAPDQPAGESLRGKPVYRTLQEARREDDPSLPQGPWEHELKRADWEKVAVLAAETVAHKSKDLQLVAWMAEAQVHRAGFLGLAASVTLMQALCDRYWDEVHPAADAGDIEHRINIFRWINEKLLPALRLVPLTAAGRDAGEYAWSDWEQARRNEQLLSAQGSIVERDLEGATVQQFTAALSGSRTAFLIETVQSVEEAKRAVAQLESLLDGYCGSDAPSLKSLGDLLTDIGLLLSGELRRRGASAVEVQPYADAPEQETWDDASGDDDQVMSFHSGAIRDRTEAYARLNHIADYLMHVEPHSPVPYLVKRAIEWGQLNTAELYELLFIRHQGQLSIFDVLGIEARGE